MPSIGFVLPHWLYWAGLLVFPLFALAMIRREERRRSRPGVSLPLAYLFLVCGGFAGLHRFYLRRASGLLYLPLLVAIVYGNAHVRDMREELSAARADAQSYSTLVTRAESALARKRAGAQDQLEKARAGLVAAEGKLHAVQERSGAWQRGVGLVAFVMLGGLAVDALLLPRAVRRAREREAAHPAPEVAAMPEDPGPQVGDRPMALAIDHLNRWVGQFVAYWTVIAVFVYYYEVVARFLFNSPTNWAHESMFLMFGMQYLLCGAYALRTGSHVRVDVLYVKMRPRGRAVADVVTSFFFFVFTVTLLWTGWRFAADAVAVGETSFSEWGIQYWAVKLSLPAGAVLLILQGVAHLLRDIDLAFGSPARRDAAMRASEPAGAGRA